MPYATVAVPLKPGVDGIGLMVIAAVVAIVLPQLLVAEIVYIPAAAVPTVNDAGLSNVDVNPFGPLHKYEVAPVAAPVRVRVDPLHTDVEDGVADTVVGVVFTVIAVVVAVVLPQLLAATSVYIPAEAVPTVNDAGTRSVEVNPFGPLHEYDVAPVAAPVSVNVLPEHIDVADGVAVTLVGTLFTVTGVVVIVDVPHPLAAESV